METLPSTAAKLTKSFIRKRWIVTTVSFRALAIWSFGEILLCSLVLLLKTQNYADNFINGLCEDSDCNNFVEVALYGRIILSFASLVGVLTGASSLTTPWILMNAFGLFPLLPVIYSSFFKYEELNNTTRKARTVLLYAGKLYDYIFPLDS